MPHDPEAVRRLATRLTEGVVLLDQEMRIQFASQSASVLLAMSMDELQGADFVHILAHKGTNVVALLPHGPDNTDQIFELRVPHESGTRTVTITSFPTRNESDGSLGYTLVVRDESAGERTEQLKLDVARLRRMDTLGGLAAGLAHDVNNVLTAVVLATEELERTLASQGVDIRSTQPIYAAVDHGAHLTGRLLDYLVGIAPSPDPVDASAVAESLLDVLRRTFGSRMELHFDKTDEPVMVGLHASLLEELLMNLAMNARDAMNGVGVLEIAVGADTGVPGSDSRFAHISIRDTGSGMTPAEATAAIEPLYTTKSSEGGTGLGLSSARSILEEIGGCLRIDSEVGAGTTVHCYLPLL